jgi:hypothetical protein
VVFDGGGCVVDAVLRPARLSGRARDRDAAAPHDRARSQPLASGREIVLRGDSHYEMTWEHN